MRNPKRIDKFCARLAVVWKMVPDWRFGQLISNIFAAYGKDPFFVEDEKMIEIIESYFIKKAGE